MGRDTRVPNVLYATFGNPITEEQIREVINRALNEYYDKVSPGTKIKSVIRVCKIRKFCGYVFVSDKEEFHMLAGLTPSGEELTRWIEDPDYVEEEDEDEGEFKFGDEIPGDWSSFIDEVPMVEIKDEPYVVIKPYDLTPDQITNPEETKGILTLETSRYCTESDENPEQLIIIVKKEDRANLPALQRHLASYVKASNRKKDYPKLTSVRGKKNLYIATYDDEDEALVTYFMIRVGEVKSRSGQNSFNYVAKFAKNYKKKRYAKGEY